MLIYAPTSDADIAAIDRALPRPLADWEGRLAFLVEHVAHAGILKTVPARPFALDQVRVREGVVCAIVLYADTAFRVQFSLAAPHDTFRFEEAPGRETEPLHPVGTRDRW